MKGLGLPIPGKPSPFYSDGYASKDMALADSEHPGATPGPHLVGEYLHPGAVVGALVQE